MGTAGESDKAINVVSSAPKLKLSVIAAGSGTAVKASTSGKKSQRRRRDTVSTRNEKEASRTTLHLEYWRRSMIDETFSTALLTMFSSALGIYAAWILMTE